MSDEIRTLESNLDRLDHTVTSNIQDLQHQIWDLEKVLGHHRLELNEILATLSRMEEQIDQLSNR